MQRKLFCEISPITYKISTYKERGKRKLDDKINRMKFAKTKSNDILPVCVCSHNSLIRRKLGNVNLELQENKAVNLSIAAPKISHLLIEPGEVFSFWSLIGKCTAKKGYKTGLIIKNGSTDAGIGGGMCQFTNLIHWLVLHTPLDIIEHHHHDNLDLFPDYGRQIPFGTGTSIAYNYIDYRFKNNTDKTFQLIVYTTDEYLCGEIRVDTPLDIKIHIRAENEFFSKEKGVVYRNSDIYRKWIDKRTGNTILDECIKKNHAKVLYDSSTLDIRVIHD